jgi:hypothetical protein
MAADGPLGEGLDGDPERVRGQPIAETTLTNTSHPSRHDAGSNPVVRSRASPAQTGHVAPLAPRRASRVGLQCMGLPPFG